MTKQSEALRLADLIQRYRSPHCGEAAAELRRLDELAESEGRWASDYLARAVKAEALNSQLLEALRFIADRQDLMFAECSDAEEIIEVARAAIAAAKEEA
jgi:hypothetical protein